MAQEIVTWCDVCLDKDEYEPATLLTVTLDGHAPRGLDVCKAHRDELTDALVAALEAFGRRPDATPKTARRPEVGAPRKGKKPAGARAYVCLWCGVDYAGTGALGTHLKTHHGFESYGEVWDGVPCPICGAGPFGNAGAIATHMARSHDVDNPIRALLDARDEGDERGAYAAVIAKADRWDGAP